MVKVIGVAAVVATLVTSGDAEFVDAVRECSRTTCTSVSGDQTLQVSCGETDDTISQVKYAGFGLSTLTCPDEALGDPIVDDVEFIENEACSVAAATAAVEAECLEQGACTVNASIFGDIDLVACGVTDISELSIDVFVTCEEPFDVTTVASTMVIAFIGLALGAATDLELFKQVYRSHKRGVLVGFACQFGFMPLLAFTMVKIFDFDIVVAIGVMIVGSCPGGTTSNLLTYYAKGNVALSITMSAASTIAALGMLPLLSFLYIETALGNDTDVNIPVASIILALLIGVIPAGLGVYIKTKSTKWATRVEKTGTAIGLIFLGLALVVGMIDNPDLINPSEYPQSWLGAALFQPIGCLVGYVVARLAKLPRPEARAVCLETGVQNFTIAIAIISISLSGCERVIVLTFPLIATVCYVINSVWITALLRWSSVRDSPAEIHALVQEAKQLNEPSLVSKDVVETDRRLSKTNLTVNEGEQEETRDKVGSL